MRQRRLGQKAMEPETGMRRELTVRRTSLTAALCAAGLLLGASVGLTQGSPQTTIALRPASSIASEEQAFLDLINEERAARGLCQLKLDLLLVGVAREHSREMSDRNYFDHISPTSGQRTPMQRYLRAVPKRPPYACVGENLFYCSVVDVDRGHRALMESPGHRANILFPRFRQCGVGIYKSPSGEFWVTQMFLTNEG
jgi:uncharacterized protein YkwD